MGWLSRLLGKEKAVGIAKPSVVLSADDHAKALEEIDGYVRRDVAGGFRAENEIIESVAEVISDEFEADAVKSLIIERTRHHLNQHALAEAEWSEPTDCDRLDSAFAELESHGIVCRQDFSCCGTCGSGEILDEMKKEAAKGRVIRGYAFYHMQDTEHAIEGAGVYLGYGSTQYDKVAAEKIAHELSATIAKHGLVTEWNGSLAQRILVKMTWRRRRLPRCVAK